MKLQMKILFSFALVVLLSALLFSLLSYWSIDKNLIQYTGAMRQYRMEQYAQIAANYYETHGNWEGVESQFQTVPGPPSDRGRKGRGMGQGWGGMGGMDGFGTSTAPGGYNEGVLLLSPDGKVLMDTSGSYPKGSQIPPDSLQGNEKPLYDKKGNLIGILLLQSALPPSLHTPNVASLENSFLRSVTEAVWISGGIAFLVAISLGLFISFQLTRPLKALIRSTRAITKGDLSMRVNISGKDELGELAASFNQMADKLERLERVRKNLIADVAHELRTPLSILRGNLESMLLDPDSQHPEKVSLLHDEVLRMAHIVNDLQNISLAEAGKLPLHPEETDLSALLRKVVMIFSDQMEEKEIQVIYRGVDAFTKVWCDPKRMEQVFVNLIGNAIRHTPPKGFIHIGIEQAEKEIRITIRDSGHGIAKEDLPFLFERFYRADKGRSRNEGGAGLGLAIVKGYIEAHGGRIEAANHPDGGSLFTILLPRGGLRK